MRTYIHTETGLCSAPRKTGDALPFTGRHWPSDAEGWQRSCQTKPAAAKQGRRRAEQTCEPRSAAQRAEGELRPIKKSKFCIVFCLLISFLSLAQGLSAQKLELSARLKDSLTEQSIFGATVLAQNLDSTGSPQSCLSNEQGEFFLFLEPGNYQVQILQLGYQSLELSLQLDSSRKLGTLFLKAYTLDSVQIEAEQVAVLQKGDTTIYHAGSFKTRANGSARDLLRKMPGLETDAEIQAQGERVAEILVDGELFGSQNAGELLDNLPATLIDKVEVYTYQSEEARMSGIETQSNQKTLNIRTKKKYRNSVFGEGQLGAGLSPPTKPVYFSALRFNSMRGQRKWNLELESANLQGTKIERLSEQSNPHNTLGLSFQDKWKKTSLNFSYKLHQRQQNSKRLLDKNALFVNGLGSFTKEEQEKQIGSLGQNARLQFRYMGKKHRLTATTMLGQSGGQELSELRTDIFDENRRLGSSTQQEQVTQNTSWNYQINLMYNLQFAKKGRGLTLSTNLSAQRQEDSSQQSIQRFASQQLQGQEQQRIENLRLHNNLRTQLSYTEPLGQEGQLQVQANWSYQLRSQKKFNFAAQQNNTEQLDSSLSTNSKQGDKLLQINPSYQWQKKNIQLRLGSSLIWQELAFSEQLQEETTDLRYFRAQPNLNLRWQAERMAFATLNYQMLLRNPSLREQQAALDNSNPASLYIGNPNLKQEVLHNITLAWNKNNILKNRNFSAQLQGQWQQNKIEQSVFVYSRDTLIRGIALGPGIQLSMPVQVQSSSGFNSMFSLTERLKRIPSSLQLSGSASFLQSPTLFNGQIQKSQQWNTGLALKWTSNISENLDIHINTASNLSNLLAEQSSISVWQQSFQCNMYWAFTKHVFLQNYLQQQYTSSSQEWIFSWNFGIALRLFKKQEGELHILCFNILDQNGSSRLVSTAQYNELSQNQNILGRYFLCKFVYHLQPRAR